MRKIHSSRGFTLIELLVVVLIIGILAAIALPQYEKSITKSRLSTGLQLIKSLSTGVEEYILVNGTMPTSLTDISMTPPLDCHADGRCYDKTFGYVMQNGNRLQAWSSDDTYGFIWNSSKQQGGATSTLFCFALAGTKADTNKYCELIGGHDKIQSPTAASYNWWYL